MPEAFANPFKSDSRRGPSTAPVQIPSPSVPEDASGSGQQGVTPDPEPEGEVVRVKVEDEQPDLALAETAEKGCKKRVRWTAEEDAALYKVRLCVKSILRPHT